MKNPLTTEWKTMLINGKIEASGTPQSLLRQSARIIRQKKIEQPSISLIKGIIIKLEEAV